MHRLGVVLRPQGMKRMLIRRFVPAAVLVARDAGFSLPRRWLRSRAQNGRIVFGADDIENDRYSICWSDGTTVLGCDCRDLL